MLKCAVMPVRLVQLAQGQGIVFSCHGRVVGKDMIDANDRVAKMDLAPLVFAVVDHSGGSELEYDGNSIKRIVEQDRQLMKSLRPGFLVAVVAPNNLEFGFSRMWQTMAEVTGWEILVVRSRDEADRWVRARAAGKFGAEVAPFRDELDAAAKP